MSNTEDFSSYSVTFDSVDLAGFKGLNTHVGYRNQSEGDADVDLDREDGYAVGANYTFPLAENIEAMVLGEWVGLRNADGGEDDMDYYTGSLGLTIHENWNLALSYTARNTDVDAGDDVDDHLFQLTGGYTFDNGISFDVGYLNTEESDVDTHTLGALLAYTYEF